MREKATTKTDKPLSSYGVLSTCLKVIFNPISFISLVKYLLEVVSTYGLLQYARKLGLSRTPIKHVDHALDLKIPFRPDKVIVYMNFISQWIRVLTMLYKRIGYKKATLVAARFMELLRTIYKEARKIYRVNLTTTDRPRGKKVRGLKGFGPIHLLDPHYLCVPSLHICIITLTHTFFHAFFKSEVMKELSLKFSTEEQERYDKELYFGCVEIAESVLYMKQHSVNCIAAALYMMTRVFPNLVSISSSCNFIKSLFLSADDITSIDRVAIVNHITLTYEMFLADGRNKNNWEDAVIKWIKNYKPYRRNNE